MRGGKPSSWSLLGLLRRLVASDPAPLTFSPCHDFTPPPLEAAGAYLHVPFCRGLCPYCPYLRQRFDPALAEPFCRAVEREMDWYAERLPALRVDSVYFGGGTPTVLGAELERLVHAVRRRLAPAGPLCIETNPQDLDQPAATRLARLGFESVSLGVQSFDARTLAAIGRGYGPEVARRALDELAASGVPSINVDLMFAIPGQDALSWQRDIEAAIAGPATQVTAYPLFTFPYAEVGSDHQHRGLRMPPWRLRRDQYYQLYDTLLAAGFRRVSVWSFQRGAGHRFSSVTRRRYLGFGPSAGSCYGSQFTLNTFSVQEYLRATAERGQAVALTMPISEAIDELMGIYWRAYDTRMPISRWRDAAARLPRLRAGLAAARLLGLCHTGPDEVALTRRGSFWIHLLQNHAVLPGVAQLWATGKRQPWPAAFTLP